MPEIQFADGKRLVDDVYVGPIMDATNREPQRYPFKVVMGRLGRAFEKDLLKNVQRDVIARHFQP